MFIKRIIQKPKQPAKLFSQFQFLKGLDIDLSHHSKEEKTINHFPVMHKKVEEVLGNWIRDTSRSNPIMLDCTIGAGGHSIKLLKKNKNLKM
jgi:hypothetical protein